MKFLILSPNQKSKYNWGHQLFREEVGLHFPTLFYGKHYPFYPKLGLNVPDLVQHFGRFDVVWVEGPKHAKEFTGMKQVDAPVKMSISVDYCRPYIKMFNKFVVAMDLNQVFLVSIRAISEFIKSQKRGNIPDHVKANLLPFSVDTDVYYKMPIEKEFDVAAIFSETPWCYANRRRIKQMLRKSKWKVLIGGASKDDRIKHGDYVEAINKSKIFVTANNIYKTLSMKYTEVLACGTFLLADCPEDFTYLGYKDGKHLVLYDGIDDLIEKIAYYLEHENEREEIARNGMDFVRENHSCKTRAHEMMEILCENFAVG